MSLSYWPYAFQTVVYLINQMLTSTLNNQSLFEKLFKQMPNYLKLKQFGCLCYPLTRPYNKHKLEPKAQPCTFVGYSLSQNAYLCFDPTTRKFFISRDVIFLKGTFPFSNPKNLGSPSSTTEDPSVTISLPQLLLVPRGTTESPYVGTKVSPSLENGSSPAPTHLQVSTLSSLLIWSSLPSVEVHEPVVSIMKCAPTE